jgi:hypothetical protein
MAAVWVDLRSRLAASGSVRRMWRQAPEGLVAEAFVLEPLGPQHNDADYSAWMASIDHILATPGFRPELWDGDDWPYLMTAAENLADLIRHADEFDQGKAFAYTVLDPLRHDVIGCVYVRPDPVADARCRLWVRADRADCETELVAAVRTWLHEPVWGFRDVRFPGRD